MKVSSGGRGTSGAMALSRPHPRQFQDKRPQAQDMGTPQRRRRMKRGFGRLAPFSAQAAARPGPCQGQLAGGHSTRRGALMPNLTTGAMRDCLGSPPAPRLRRIIRRHQGSHALTLRLSHSPVPATTDGSVEPHTHHRRPPHASVALGSQGHMGRGGDALSSAWSSSAGRRHEAHARLSQTPDSRSSTPDLWAWGNVA